MEDIDNNPNIYKILGNNIKKIRTKEHISQERLADLIGKSSHFISLLERGESGVAIGTFFVSMLHILFIRDSICSSCFCCCLLISLSNFSLSTLNRFSSVS